MKFSIPVFCLSVISISVSARELDWRFRTQSYATSAVSYIPQNVSSIEIDLSLNCFATGKAATDESKAVIGEMDAIAREITGDFTANAATATITVSPNARYDVVSEARNSLEYKVSDGCPALPAQVNGYTQKVFATNTTFKYQLTDHPQELSLLNTRLKSFIDQYTRANPAARIYVSSINYSVDPAVLAKNTKTLQATTRLSQQPSRLTVDTIATGGFAEFYTSAATPSYGAEYKDISPELDADGNAILKAFYHFHIDYTPANQVGATANSEIRGTLDESIEGQHVVKTDYYTTSFTLETKCNASAQDAKNKMATPLQQIVEAANTVVAQGPRDYRNRLVVNEVNSPQASREHYSTWRAVLDDARETHVVSYLNLCDGKVYEGEYETLPEAYTSTQRISISATDFRALKALEEKVDEINSGNPDQSVVVSMRKIVPRIEDEKHRAALEVYAYANAVEKLLDPHGIVATKLLDEVQAQEAYYSFVSYGAFEDGVIQKSARMGAPAAPAFAGAAPAPAEENAIEISSDNVPLHENAVRMSYTAQFRAKKDLISQFKEARASGQAIKIDIK